MASFFIQKTKSYRAGWRLLKQEFDVNKKRRKTVVPKSAWHSLGFKESMTLEDAKNRASQLNALNTIKRHEQQAIANIAARLERDQLHNSAFIPETLNKQFLEWIEENVAPKQVEKTKITWGTCKKILIRLKLSPEQVALNKGKIYRHLAERHYSRAYTSKMIAVINHYLKFVSRLTGKFYEPLPQPKGHTSQMIADSYFDSANHRGGSEPLTPDLLEEAKTNLKPEQYRWLYCTIWLGLRPAEVDMISRDKDNKFWRIDEESHEVDVLWVYQSKLTSLPRDQRWKLIPLIYPEQETAKSYLFTDLQRPIMKTMRKYFPGRVTPYGGRKAFESLMKDRGQIREDISQWMGHRTINMTLAHYVDRKRVHFKDVK